MAFSAIAGGSSPRTPPMSVRSVERSHRHSNKKNKSERTDKEKKKRKDKESVQLFYRPFHQALPNPKAKNPTLNSNNACIFDFCRGRPADGDSGNLDSTGLKKSGRKEKTHPPPKTGHPCPGDRRGRRRRPPAVSSIPELLFPVCSRYLFRLSVLSRNSLRVVPSYMFIYDILDLTTTIYGV